MIHMFGKNHSRVKDIDEKIYEKMKKKYKDDPEEWEAIEMLYNEIKSWDEEESDERESTLDKIQNKVIKNIDFENIYLHKSIITYTLIDDYWNLFYKINKRDLILPILKFLFLFMTPFFVVWALILTDGKGGVVFDRVVMITLFVWVWCVYQPSFFGILEFFQEFLLGLKKSIHTSYTFDFHNGYVYPTKYQKKLFSLKDQEKYKDKIIPLREISAVQILGSSFPKQHYELRLMFQNSTRRLHIVNYKKLDVMRKDADLLAKRLDVKVDETNVF